MHAATSRSSSRCGPSLRHTTVSDQWASQCTLTLLTCEANPGGAHGATSTGATELGAPNSLTRKRCLQEVSALKKQLIVEGPADSGNVYTFDHVAEEEANQDHMFELVGRPVMDQCLQGYNGTVLAYG